MSNTTNLDNYIKVLLAVAFALLVFSFFAPLVFTNLAFYQELDFTSTGEIGDTIGGIMNPFVAVAGVIVTGLAFYIQYKANLQQRDFFLQEQNESKNQFQSQINNQNAQIKLQQFEAQFYEMLRLHRENILEMKIVGYDFDDSGHLEKYEKTTEGRKIFVTMQTELECILAMHCKDGILDKEEFNKCYKLFFSGLDEYEKTYPENKVFIELLKKARTQHEYPDKKKIKKNHSRKEFLPNVKLNFNYKPFSGHASRLGHYFRHLYLTVKTIANSDIITDYGERMKYLRILRAQLSNHEQILLFYNWLSEYGSEWENETHQFFTEYCIIHNLRYNTLFEDALIKDTINTLKTKPVHLRKGYMFEIDFRKDTNIAGNIY